MKGIKLPSYQAGKLSRSGIVPVVISMGRVATEVQSKHRRVLSSVDSMLNSLFLLLSTLFGQSIVSRLARVGAFEFLADTSSAGFGARALPVSVRQLAGLEGMTHFGFSDPAFLTRLSSPGSLLGSGTIRRGRCGLNDGKWKRTGRRNGDRWFVVLGRGNVLASKD
jgi:hypothetical protein